MGSSQQEPSIGRLCAFGPGFTVPPPDSGTRHGRLGARLDT